MKKHNYLVPQTDIRMMESEFLMFPHSGDEHDPAPGRRGVVSYSPNYEE